MNAVQCHSLLSGHYDCNVLMFAIVRNVYNFATSLGLSFEGVVFVLVRSCFLITLIKCLKGHMCLGSLCLFRNQNVCDCVGHSVTGAVLRLCLDSKNISQEIILTLSWLIFILPCWFKWFLERALEKFFDLGLAFLFGVGFRGNWQTLQRTSPNWPHTRTSANFCHLAVQAIFD